MDISKFKLEMEQKFSLIKPIKEEASEKIKNAQYKDKIKVPINNILSTIKILQQCNEKK